MSMENRKYDCMRWPRVLNRFKHTAIYASLEKYIRWGKSEYFVCGQLSVILPQPHVTKHVLELESLPFFSELFAEHSNEFELVRKSVWNKNVLIFGFSLKHIFLSLCKYLSVFFLVANSRIEWRKYWFTPSAISVLLVVCVVGSFSQPNHRFSQTPYTIVRDHIPNSMVRNYEQMNKEKDEMANCTDNKNKTCGSERPRGWEKMLTHFLFSLKSCIHVKSIRREWKGGLVGFTTLFVYRRASVVSSAHLQ